MYQKLKVRTRAVALKEPKFLDTQLDSALRDTGAGYGAKFRSVWRLFRKGG